MVFRHLDLFFFGVAQACHGVVEACPVDISGRSYVHFLWAGVFFVTFEKNFENPREKITIDFNRQTSVHRTNFRMNAKHIKQFVI